MGSALAGERESPRIAFASVDLLHRVCAPKRLAVLRAMAGAGPLPVREVARRVGRDVKAVHRDMTALVKAGLLDRDEGGPMSFPYDGVPHGSGRHARRLTEPGGSRLTSGKAW